MRTSGMRGARFKGGAAVAAGVALVGIHFATFVRFFPNSSGRLGHDWGYFLSHLLDGYFWARGNGLSIPWFSPGLCGGVPRFPNPQALYYSLPQIATWWSDPLIAIWITLAICAAVGFFGTYRLLRDSFATRRAAALLGATLFLWNSLFWARLAIGHLTFHAFMLIPLLAWLVLESERVGRAVRGRALFGVCGASLCIAYLAMTSLPHVLLPGLAATASLLLLRGIVTPREGSVARRLVALGAAGLLALGLTAFKLVPMYAYVSLFSRTSYPLPGVDGVGRLIGLAARILFLGAPREHTERLVTNSQWTLQTHEFEYGVGPVALGILTLALGCGLYAMRSSPWRPAWSADRWLALGGLALLLSLPLALNYYSPEWNAFLKAIPFIGSGSTQLRWFALYIPVASVGTALALDRTPLLRDYATIASAVGIAGVVSLGVVADRTHYDRQTFDPSGVLSAHAAAKAGGRSPAIDRVGRLFDASGTRVRGPGRNAGLAHGISTLNCYETLFGFGLEHFPRGSLHAGPALKVTDGVLNLKDPSCYVFPQENGCAPGDHFDAERRMDAEALLHWAPYEFQRSRTQRLAEGVSGLFGVGLALALAFAAVDARRGYRGLPSTAGNANSEHERPPHSP